MTRQVSRSADETESLGREFARTLRPGDVVALTGTLGSGKTRFVAGVCGGLGVTARVTSPTFTIINEYPAPFGIVAHVDLYRIDRRGEIAELGLEEYFHARCICLIEWAEHAPGLPPSHIRVTMSHGAGETEREILVEAGREARVIILGVETATAVCAAAVAADGRVMAEAAIESENVHAERLVGQIEEVLRRAGTAFSALDGIAVSIGPGSFTGLRIGLSVAKGLAYARSLPLIGVPTLPALAQHVAAVEAVPEGTAILTALDARRDEVYCQLFERTSGEIVPVWDAADMTVQELGGRVGGRDVLVAGNAAQKVIAGFPGMLRAATPEASRCSAAAVAILGEVMLRRSGADDAAALEPRYIKEFFLKTR